MKEQLVVKATQILSILFEENCPTGMNVNEICRRTGSKDKPLIIDSIKYLEKGRLVEAKRTHYKQKKMKVLTSLGRTFADLIHSVEIYNESYIKLKETVRQNFDQSKYKHKRILVNLLRSRGWKREEATEYRRLYEGAHSLLYHLSPRHNIDALLTRYVSILAQYRIIENENAKVILNKVVTDLLSKQFSVIQNDLEDNPSLQDEGIIKDEQPFDYVATDKFNIIDILITNTKSLENRFVDEEGKAVVLALLNILKPSRKAFDGKYDSIGEVVDIYLKQLQSLHQMEGSSISNSNI